MGWYFIICILLLFFFLLQFTVRKNGKEGEKFFLLCAVAILSFFAAFRSVNVGVDTVQYAYGYEQIKRIPWSKLYSTRILAAEGWDYAWEFGYKVYNKLISTIFFFVNGPQIITAVNSIILFVFLSALIKRQSPDMLLSLWLYMVLGFYQTALNMMPSAITSALCLWGTKYIKSKKVVPWCLVITAAALFHTSGLFFLPLYWIDKIKITPRKYITLWIAIVLCFVFYTAILSQFTRFIPQRYQYYLESDRTKYESFLVYLVLLALYAFCYLLLKSEKKHLIAIQTTPGIWCFLITTLFYLLSLKSFSGMSRMAFSYAIYIIVFVPKLLSSLSNERKAILARRLIIAFALITYIARLYVNNIGQTVPYEFFFS